MITAEELQRHARMKAWLKSLPRNAFDRGIFGFEEMPLSKMYYVLTMH
jgi:hypothetical protein